jgi:DNA-binding response OmpR family regulator
MHMSDLPNTLILVVDDDWMNREMMQAYLERSGFRVAVAHDAESALSGAASLMPALILLDVRMGERDGYEVCLELKGQEKTRAIPVVMLSALAHEDARTRALEVGAMAFLTKTTNLSNLVAQIREFLQPLA